MTTNTATRHSSGPVWDWSAGHGPVTGALSATTGAFALATTGAATGMPPGWALAVGTAGALGHTVAALSDAQRRAAPSPSAPRPGSSAAGGPPGP